MKKLLTLVIAAALTGAMAIAATAEVPAPWMDADFSTGKIVDKAGNVTFDVMDGEIGDAIVNHTDKSYSVKAFKGSEEGDYIDMNMPFNDEKELGEFLWGGHSFEILLQIDNHLPFGQGNHAMLVGCCKGGGYGLYLQDTNTFYTALGAEVGGNYYELRSTTLVNDLAGTLAHVIATYDAKAKTMNIYINGVLDATRGVTPAPFKNGTGYFDIWGLGYNPASSEENIGKNNVPFSIVDCNIYNVALSESEAAEAYANAIKAATVTEATEITDTSAPEESAADAETPAESASDTDAVSDESPEDSAETADTADTSDTTDGTDEEKGSPVIIIVIAAAAIIIAAAAVILTKKKK